VQFCGTFKKESGGNFAGLSVCRKSPAFAGPFRFHLVKLGLGDAGCYDVGKWDCGVLELVDSERVVPQNHLLWKIDTAMN